MFRARESSRRARATVLKPSSCSSSGQLSPSGRYVQGTRNTLPMLTRAARRYRGSLPAAVSSTASTFRAAADRKMAPMLVGFMMFSSTAMRRALAQTSATEGSRGRRMAHSIPRVRWKPVSWVSTGRSAAYTGISAGQRASTSAPFPSMCLRSIRKDSGVHPASRARPMTRGLSATNRAFSGSARFTSWFSVSRA